MNDRIPRRVPQRHNVSQRPTRPQPTRQPRQQRPLPRKYDYEEELEENIQLDHLQQDQINYLINSMRNLQERMEQIGTQQMAEIRDVRKSEDAFITEDAIQKYETILANAYETIKTIEKTGTKEDLSQKTQEFFDNIIKGKRETSLKIAENLVARYEDIREHYIRSLKDITQYVGLLKENYQRARDLSEFTKPVIESASEELTKTLIAKIEEVMEDFKPDREIITKEQEELMQKQEALQTAIEKKNKDIEELVAETKKSFVERLPAIVGELTDAMKTEIQKETVKSIKIIRQVHEEEEKQELARLKEIVEELREERKNISKTERKVKEIIDDEEEEEEEEPDTKKVRVRSGKKLPKDNPKNDHQTIKDTVGEYDVPKKNPHEDMIDPETGEYMI